MEFARVETLLQQGIDALLPLDPVQPRELPAYDDGLEMMAVTLHGHMLAGESGGDPLFDEFWVEHCRYS